MTATRALIFASIAVALLPGTSIAQNPKNQGYLVDTYENNITTRSETELCMRSNEWTPTRVTQSCDPIIEKAEAPATGSQLCQPGNTLRCRQVNNNPARR